MKKFLNYVMIFMLFMIITTNVKAQEIYYENSHGITFTKEEYDFFSKMYYDGYQKFITQEDYALFEGQELNKKNIKKVTKVINDYVPGEIQTMGSYHETQAKILQITKSDKVVAIIAQWKYSPNVRSYDLIGAYFSGVKLSSGISSNVTYDNSQDYSVANVTASSGFGSVVKLPTNGRDIVVTTTFMVSGSGTVFGSYQHAKKTISLNNAKSFSISYSGLGNVFYFSNMNIRAKYDAMQGVSIGV